MTHIIAAVGCVLLLAFLGFYAFMPDAGTVHAMTGIGAGVCAGWVAADGVWALWKR